MIKNRCTTECFLDIRYEKTAEKQKNLETLMNSKYSENSNPTTSKHLKKSRFTEMLIEANALDSSTFESWVFCHGMLFNNKDKWWGNYGQRDYPHEGIELCLYSGRSRKIRRIGETTRIPLMHDGVVKAIFKDYLGQSVVLEHKNANNNIEKFISMYAHTNPRSGIEIGSVLQEGDIIATLGDTRNLKSKILPHLHFSLGLPAHSFSYDRFVWNTIRMPDMITLLDPLPIIDWPYRVLDGVTPARCEL